MKSKITLWKSFQPVSEPHYKRFTLFRLALKRELGDIATLAADGSVIVHANEFSPAQSFSTLQGAIDHYARYMPEALR